MTATGLKRPLDLVQSFGVEALLILVCVTACWVYLKRIDEPEVLLLPDIPALLASTQSGAAAPLPSQASLRSADHWVRLGEEAFAAGRITEPMSDNAVYFFDNALAEDPEHAEAQQGLNRVARYLRSNAESAIHESDWAGARSYAEQLGALAPQSSQALELIERIDHLAKLDELLALAQAQFSAGKLTKPRNDNARETYQQIAELAPGNVDARRGLRAIAERLLSIAQSEALTENRAESLALIETAKAIDPNVAGLDQAEQFVARWSEMVQKERLQKLAEAASEAVQAGRLTAPAQPNALALYNAMLEQDPASAEAQRGKQQVAAALAARASAEVEAGRLDDAATTLKAASAAGAPEITLVPIEGELEYRRVIERARRGEFDYVYALNELDVRRQEAPDYPRHANGQGWVSVRFTVSETGDAVDAVVNDSSDEAFHEEALRALDKWKFKPFTVDGRPVPVRSAVRFEFIDQR